MSSCCVVDGDLFRDEVVELKKFYDNVSLNVLGRVIELWISNNAKDGKFEEVFFNAKFYRHHLPDVVSFFTNENYIDGGLALKELLKGIYILEISERHLPDQELLEDVFLHFASLLIDYFNGGSNSFMESNYSYRGVFFDLDNGVVANTKEKYINALNEGMCDLELYHLFSRFKYNISYRENKNFLVINYFLGAIGYLDSYVKHFSICNDSVINTLRNLSKMPKVDFDEQKMIIETSLDALDKYSNHDRVTKGLKSIDRKDISLIAMRCKSSKEFMNKIIDGVGGMNSGCGYAVGDIFGVGFSSEEKDPKKPTFTVEIFEHTLPLLKGKTINDGYINFPDIDNPVGYAEIVLFDSREHDIFELIWNWFKNGIFTIKSKKPILMSIETNDEFELSEDLLQQKAKIINGGSLLDLMLDE